MKKVSAVASGALWLIVLVPVLLISAYSLFWVARHLGVPPLFAALMSTCFDGAALLMARSSLRYAQAGLSGARSRFWVLVFAGASAYLQTLHARYGNEPYGAWLMWASLPIIAVVLYENHIRWERRKALERAGVVVPPALPHLGWASWAFFPIKAAFAMRDLTATRMTAIVSVTKDRVAIPAPRRTIVAEVEKEEPVTRTAEPNEQAETSTGTNERTGTNGPNVFRLNTHAPHRHIRAWLKENGHPDLADRGALSADLIAEYDAAHEQTGSGP
jgi:hypothetical protein